MRQGAAAGLVELEQHGAGTLHDSSTISMSVGAQRDSTLQSILDERAELEARGCTGSSREGARLGARNA